MGRSKQTSATTSGNDDNKHDQAMQAVLLADSFTKTFRPLSMDKAKVLSPLNNVVMLDYAMEFLAGAGVEELFVVCCHDEVEVHVENNTWSNTSMQVTVVKDSSITNAGDALRELDKRALVKSDPFILMYGDVVTNLDIAPVLEAHKIRHKRDSSAIMTLLLKQVGGWHDSSSSAYSKLRAFNEDLIVGINPQQENRILVFDDHSQRKMTSVPCSFFTSHAQVELRCDLLDCGIYVCSPDVLARFSDEFDYRDIRREFITNSVAEEEEGLQNKIHGHILGPTEYAARVHDFSTYAAISKDLLRRWCYPVVPDNLPSGYEKLFRYSLKRHFLYRETKRGRTRVGRSTQLKGAGMIGSDCIIGDSCNLEGTVVGNNCNIADGVVLRHSHLWDGVTIEKNVYIEYSILAQDVTIKAGAKIGRGCVIGCGCIIGENVVLPEFTRITLREDQGDDDGFDGFSDEEDDPAEEDSNDSDDVIVSDHDVVGEDGKGKVWHPVVDDDDSDEEDQENSHEHSIQAQSIGFDASELYHERAKLQIEDGDEFSEPPDDLSGEFDDTADGAVTFGGDISAAGSGVVIGRQKGVDVVKELKLICLEHEESAPVENLAIELNSFKFSQNATYSDCTMATMLAILEKMNISVGMSAGKLVGALKTRLEYWSPLLQKMSISIEEEKSIILALERAATGNKEMSKTLGTEPNFRFVLQTLHDEEVLSEEAILSWAAKRREEGSSSEFVHLFNQQPTQDFLEWLEEDEDDSEESSDSEDND